MAEFIRNLYNYILVGLITAAFYDITVYCKYNVKVKLRVLMAIIITIGWLPIHVWAIIQMMKGNIK